MKKIVIIGAGGFGREVKVLIDQLNTTKPQFDIIGFFDDKTDFPKIINGIPYLGNLDRLIHQFNGESLNVVLGIGDPITKFKIISKLKDCDFNYPRLIHPSCIIGKDNVTIGIGTIIAASTIITCDIEIGDFVTLNLSCTVGHDTTIKSYSSFMPSVNISGEVIIEEKVYVGTGAKIINQIEIGEETIVGAGAVVSKSLPPKCTAVGIPAKPIKFN